MVRLVASVNVSIPSFDHGFKIGVVVQVKGCLDAAVPVVDCAYGQEQN